MSSEHLFDLKGKVAIVTGASSGLGRRFALTLARAGAKVALGARRTELLADLARQIEGFDGRAIPVQLDVTDGKAGMEVQCFRVWSVWSGGGRGRIRARTG